MNNGFLGNQIPMNQMGINMMGNFPNNMNNQNLMNNIYPIQNQINPLMNFNIPTSNNMNNGMGQNNNQMPIQMNFNYINPYQRILELENIIREKDIEIEKLKQLIKNQNYDDMVDFLQNDGESFLFEENNFDFDENKGDFWEINFKFTPSNNNDNPIELKETCNINEKVFQVEKRISKKLNKSLNQLKFVVFSNEIPRELKLIEAGLYDKSTVTVTEKKKRRN